MYICGCNVHGTSDVVAASVVYITLKVYLVWLMVWTRGPGSVHPPFRHKIFNLLHRCKRCCPSSRWSKHRLPVGQQPTGGSGRDATLRRSRCVRALSGVKMSDYSQHGLAASTHMFYGWFEIVYYFYYLLLPFGARSHRVSSANDYILHVRTRFCCKTLETHRLIIIDYCFYSNEAPAYWILVETVLAKYFTTITLRM